MRYHFHAMVKDIQVSSRASSLRRWYQRPLGKLLAEAELVALEAELPTLFGYHLMVIDPPWEHCHLGDSRIPHHIIQSVEPLVHQEAGLGGSTEDSRKSKKHQSNSNILFLGLQFLYYFDI